MSSTMHNSLIRANWIRVAAFVVIALALGSIAAANAQGPSPAAKQPAPASSTAVSFDVLRGNWVRPDGGYRIEVKSIASSGQMEAMYFNPNPLPFEKAQVKQDGSLLRVSLELRAGGYGGSTYELTYDAASDQLKGIYYQAVMKQKFDVVFARKK